MRKFIIRTNIPTDNDGQPVNPRINAARRQARGMDELIGLCEGLIADGRVVQMEAEYLTAWLEQSVDVVNKWPVREILIRIDEMLSDGVLDTDEQAELLELLHGFTGDAMVIQGERLSTSLPLDSPLPDVRFSGRSFCFTGRFAWGDRAACETETIRRFGAVHAAPTTKTDYLVIGTFTSRDWKHSSFGTKIMRAVELRDKFHPVTIIPEQHWAEALRG